MYSCQKNPKIMWRTIPEPPLSKFNNIMAKAGITPRYEVIFEEARRGMEKFAIRVTCPISRGGQPVSADGSYGRSKREAKHNAALAFMQTYLNYGKEAQHTKVQTSPTSPPKPAVNIAVNIRSKELDLLEDICSKSNLGRPEVKDRGASGLSRAPTFTAECEVSGLRIEGKGSSKSEARLQAIVKMIQIVTGTASIHEILKFPKLTPLEVQLALESTNNESVSSSTDQAESQLRTRNDLNGKQMDSKSLGKPEERPTIRPDPDKARSLLELMNAHKKVGKIEDCNNNLVPDMARSDKLRKNLTQLQVVSQIDRMIGNLEEQLCDKILNALVYCGLSNRQTIPILSHDYEVIIQENYPPQIVRGNTECTDQSIRVACLTRLMIELKKNIEINQ